MPEIKDQSTVFSICPMDINEFKPGIYPGTFLIPACKDETNPQRLLIEKPSVHLMYVGGRKEPIRIPTPSYTIAESIVRDFLDKQIFATPAAHPGICFFQGDISVTDFKTKYIEIYKELIRKQKSWYLEIIRETDRDWNKTHNLRVVSDQAKFAVKYLGLEKEWMSDEVKALDMVNCPACMSKVSPKQIICHNCKCILNKAEADKLAFAS